MKKDTHCHQFLFGYNGGHKLLKGSRELNKEEKTLLLTYSDLIADHASSVDTYLTGIPLPSSGGYALMATWMATELRRPGCVWTHALIFTNEQIDKLCLLEPPKHWFRRPDSNGDYSSYSKLFQYEHKYGLSLELINKRNMAEFVRSIYEPNATRCFSKSSLGEAMLFHVWMKQNSNVKHSFSFRTAGLVRSKSKYENDFSVRLVDEESSPRETFEPLDWELLLATYFLVNNPELSNFVNTVGQYVKPDRNQMRFLAQLYLRVEGLNRGKSNWIEFISQFRQAMPSVDGDKIVSLFLNRREMLKFGLKAPNIEQVVDMMTSELGSGSDRWANVEWRNLGLDLSKNQKRSLVDKLLYAKNRLPLPVEKFLLEQIGLDILSFDLDKIPVDLCELVEVAVMQNKTLNDFDLMDKKVIRNIVNIISEDSYFINQFVSHLIHQDHSNELQYLSKKYPNVVMSVIYDCIGQSNKNASPKVRYIDALRNFPDHQIYQELEKYVTSEIQLYAALKATEFNLSGGLSLSTTKWALLIEGLTENQLSRKTWLQVQSFLLAIGLSRYEQHAEIIFEKCFFDVFKAWGNGQLNKASKKILKNAIPGGHAPWTWDWCQELFHAVKNIYVENSLNSEWLNEVVYDYEVNQKKSPDE